MTDDRIPEFERPPMGSRSEGEGMPVIDPDTGDDSGVSPLRPGFTRMLVTVFSRQKERVEQSRLSRFLMGILAFGILGGAMTWWFGGIVMPVIIIWAVLGLILVLSVFVDIVFVLPTLLLIVLFWFLVTLAATADVLFRTREVLQPQNRIVLAVHGINIALMAMIVWLIFSID